MSRHPPVSTSRFQLQQCHTYGTAGVTCRHGLSVTDVRSHAQDPVPAQQVCGPQVPREGTKSDVAQRSPRVPPLAPSLKTTVSAGQQVNDANSQAAGQHSNDGNVMTSADSGGHHETSGKRWHSAGNGATLDETD